MLRRRHQHRRTDMGRLSQLISQANGAPIGNLNTRIYQLGVEANASTTGIRDVTLGNTNFNGVTGFSAAWATTKPADGAR